MHRVTVRRREMTPDHRYDGILRDSDYDSASVFLAMATIATLTAW